MSKLDLIFAQNDSDAIIGDLQELVLEHKPDEKTWSWPERLIVILGSFERWALNGGFYGYLNMPTSSAVKDCIVGLREIGCGSIAEALEHSLRLYPRWYRAKDVTRRQEYSLSDSAKERMEIDSCEFWRKDDFFRDQLAGFARINVASFRWIDELPN